MTLQKSFASAITLMSLRSESNIVYCSVRLSRNRAEPSFFCLLDFKSPESEPTENGVAPKHWYCFEDTFSCSCQVFAYSCFLLSSVHSYFSSKQVRTLKPSSRKTFFQNYFEFSLCVFVRKCGHFFLKWNGVSRHQNGKETAMSKWKLHWKG